MKPIISIMLLAAFAVLTLAGCAGNTEDSIPSDTSTTAAETETTLDDMYPYPSETYDGATFDIIVLRSGYWNQDVNDLYVESDSGEAIDSAVYKRNMSVEDRYDIKITQTESSDAISQIVTLVTANDDVYEVVQDKLVYMMSTLAAGKYVTDFYSIPNVNLEAPWYDKYCVSELSIANKLFVINGDISISDKIGVDVTMFNKSIADKYQIPDLYKTVKDGSWTLDKLHEYASTTTEDIDGDGKMTKADQWGLIAEAFVGWSYLNSSGSKIAETDDEMLPYFTIYTDKSVSVLEKVCSIMNDKTARDGNLYVAEDYQEIFESDRALFLSSVLSTAATYRSMDTDFGIIPNPKYDETQTEYCGSKSPWVSRYIAVPLTNTSLDMTGAVLDAMSRQGTDTVIAAYYDVMLDNKVARDTESADMLDIVLSINTYDIGAIFNWGGTWFMYQKFFLSGSDDFASTYEKYKTTADTELAKTIEAFRSFN